ncbi:hypothetical protein [Geobacillus subterraneus]|uniref:hypothetical protein n=1 Tax=Geobacillus subterraneus TaxID=129338 RepID=UPI00161CE52E
MIPAPKNSRHYYITVVSRKERAKYKEHLMKEGYAVSIINKKINSLKVYNDFLRTERIVNELFIQLKRDRIKIADGSEESVDALSEEQVFFVSKKCREVQEKIHRLASSRLKVPEVPDRGQRTAGSRRERSAVNSSLP